MQRNSIKIHPTPVPLLFRFENTPTTFTDSTGLKRYWFDDWLDGYVNNVAKPALQGACQLFHVTHCGYNISLNVTLPLKPVVQAMLPFAPIIDQTISRMFPELGPIVSSQAMQMFLAMLQRMSFTAEGGLNIVYFQQSDTLGGFVYLGGYPTISFPQSAGGSANVGVFGGFGASTPKDWEKLFYCAGVSGTCPLTPYGGPGLYGEGYINPDGTVGGAGFGGTWGSPGVNLFAGIQYYWQIQDFVWKVMGERPEQVP